MQRHQQQQQPHHYHCSYQSNDRWLDRSTYVLFIGMHYPTGIRTGGMQHMIKYWRRFHKYINKAAQKKKRSILQGVQRGRDEKGRGRSGTALLSQAGRETRTWQANVCLMFNANANPNPIPIPNANAKVCKQLQAGKCVVRDT